jgi:hypothetical protein
VARTLRPQARTPLGVRLDFLVRTHAPAI